MRKIKFPPGDLTIIWATDDYVVESIDGENNTDRECPYCGEILEMEVLEMMDDMGAVGDVRTARCECGALIGIRLDTKIFQVVFKDDSEEESDA